MMTEKEITNRFIKEFKQLFPMLQNASTLIESSLENTGRIVDIALGVNIKGKEKILFCEVVGQGYPKQLRGKAVQLSEITEGGKSGYPVIIAPYISELGRETCKKMGVGFLDLSGNAYLNFDSFYLEIEGKSNKFKVKRGLESLFMPKAERILRFHLLKTWPEGKWTGSYRDIAKDVSVSLGQVVKVNKKLDELGFWIEEQEGLRRLDRTKLLNVWRNNYRFDRSKIFSLYSLRQILEIEEKIAEFCDKNNILYALTLFSGANRLAPFTRYTIATSYYSGDIDDLKKALDLKEVPTGANVQIVLPYDEGVYYKAEKVNAVMVANPIQIYLDLYNYKGRGREQAEFLRERVIKV